MSTIEVIRDHIGVDFSKIKKASTFDTLITIKDELGNVLQKDIKNMTILGGRTSTLEQVFGIAPNPNQKIFLNSPEILGVNHDKNPFDPATPVEQRKRRVGWFTFGVGAENTQIPGKVFKPKNYETGLYKYAPFRCVPVEADLSAEEQVKYRLRKEVIIDGDRFYAYYAKAFEVSAVNVEFNEADYIPIASHTTPVFDDDTSHPLSGGEVLTYVQFVLSVEKQEFKEWYRLMNNNSLEDAKVTELGLVMASDLPNALAGNRLELAGAEMFAKLTHSPVYLDTENSRRIVEYMVFT